MPSVKKSAAAAATATAVATEPVVPAPVPAPVEKKGGKSKTETEEVKEKKSKSKKSEPAVVAPSVPEVVAPIAEVEASAPADVIDASADLTAALDGYFTRYRAWLAEGVLLSKESKSIGKLALKEKKERDKAALKKGRKRKSDGKRSLSGFAAPAKISDQLADFLGHPRGTCIARTQVTKELAAYIKDHELKESGNGRNLIPDEKLKELLKLTSDDKLSYFNLQKYIKIHFERKKPAVAV